jgi:hypothetical protein
MIEQLKQYPKAIASVEEKLLHLNREVEIQTQLLGFLAGEIEKNIADDKSLKNDQHRKAKRLELQQQPDYLQIWNSFKQAKEDRDCALIKLNQLRNEFSVMKLEVRMMVAQLEVAA